jgi:hypothetical protein
MPREAKYGDLLADEDLRRWHDNLAAGSLITVEVYLRTLGLYCELEKTSPKKIVEYECNERIRLYVIDCEGRLVSPGSCAVIGASFPCLIG